MSLSSRSAQVLGDILRATAPVRLAEISARVGVSERTVKTDINQARRWLEARGYALSSAGTRGLWVNCSEAERAALLAQVRPSTLETDQRGRRATICLLTLLAEGPTSINSLSDDLGVARNTVLHDLADVELELEPFDIRLERTRLGLTAVGPRAKALLALDQVLRANLRHDDLAWLTSFVWDPTRLDVDALSLPLRLVFERLPHPEATSALLTSVIESLTVHFAAPSDIAIGGMLLRLSLVLVMPGESDPPDEAADDLRGLILGAARRFADVTGVTLGSEELDFVFQEAYLVAAAHEMDSGASNWESVRGVAQGLIERVDTHLNADLSGDERLLQGLTAHLSDRFAKLRNAIIEPNMIVQEVLVQYAQIYRAVEEACKDHLQLSEADLSFLVLHFAAAYERYLNRPRVRTLIVCATGRGVANLIGLLVQSRFPPIEIVRTTSMFEVQQGGVADVDLVISTFPVTVGKPTAVIRSVPTKRDFEAIEEKLEQVAQGVVGPMRSSAARSMTELGSSYPGLVSLGVSLNRELTEAAGVPLTAAAAEGLLLHCLLLAERLASGRQYQANTTSAADEALADRLRAVFEARQLRIQESELQAIVAYFDLKEES
ncbi:MAG: PRD domain-containing protein [Arachnia sp.]